MRVLFDTNVLLDVLLDREPWVEWSSACWQANDEGRITGYVTACSIPDIFYIARRLKDRDVAYKAVRICLDAFNICLIDAQTLEQAMGLAEDDFEDNLQIAAAAIAGLDTIVTRDKEGFAEAALPVLTPEELMQQIG